MNDGPLEKRWQEVMSAVLLKVGAPPATLLLCQRMFYYGASACYQEYERACNMSQSEGQAYYDALCADLEAFCDDIFLMVASRAKPE